MNTAPARLALAASVLLLFGSVAARKPIREAADLPADTTILYADVAGWYERTPNEVAVISVFDLSLDGLANGLPYDLGEWTGADRPPDPAVAVWFNDPEVAIERTYRRADGAIVWLSAFGSRGDKSFHLFEHTPVTCYPLSGWHIDVLERRWLDLGPRPLAINYGTAAAGGERLAFFYVYLWDSPSRDPKRGLVSLRLAAPELSGRPDAETTLLRDFAAALFPRTLSWSPF